MLNSNVLSFTLTTGAPFYVINLKNQANEREFVIGSTSVFSGGASIQINRYTSALTGWTPILAPGTLIPLTINTAGAGISLKYFSSSVGTAYQFILVGGDGGTAINIDFLSQ